MSGQWKVEHSWGSDKYFYDGEESILRYISSYADQSNINFYIRCAHDPNPAKTKELIQKVQRLFRESIHEIQSNESQEEQIELADFKRAVGSYPEIFIREPEFKISESAYKDSWINGKYTQLGFQTYARRYIAIFINILDVVFNLGETTDKLYTSYDINFLYANLPSLKSLVDSDRFEDALKKAKESAKYPRYANIQLELAEYLEETDRCDLAYKIYDSIDKAHPLVEKAQQRIFCIIQNTKTAEELGLVSMTEGEKSDMVVAELDSLMHCPEEDQLLADQRIHELCGYNDFNPVLTNVRYDPQTILAFCDHIRSLKEKITILEERKNS